MQVSTARADAMRVIAGARSRARFAVATALVVTIVSGCAGPTMLQESDFEDVYVNPDPRRPGGGTHSEDGRIPGFTYSCRSYGLESPGRGPTSTITLDGEESPTYVGAAALEAEPYSTSEEMLDGLLEGADACSEAAERFESLHFETLTGLDDGVTGWRTEDSNEWGEVVVTAIDDTHLLVVGFSTSGAETAVDIEELLRLGREGAERFGHEFTSASTTQ